MTSLLDGRKIKYMSVARTSPLVSNNIKIPQQAPKGPKHNEVLQQCSLIPPT